MKDKIWGSELCLPYLNFNEQADQHEAESYISDGLTSETNSDDLEEQTNRSISQVLDSPKLKTNLFLSLADESTVKTPGSVKNLGASDTETFNFGANLAGEI